MSVPPAPHECLFPSTAIDQWSFMGWSLSELPIPFLWPIFYSWTNITIFKWHSIGINFIFHSVYLLALLVLKIIFAIFGLLHFHMKLISTKMIYFLTELHWLYRFNLGRTWEIIKIFMIFNLPKHEHELPLYLFRFS